MSEWCRYNFDLLDHERIAGADLTHIPKAYREVMREAMHSLYWRAIVTLQRQRSNDGLIARHALWGPLEARRGVAEELARVGMLEERETFYYPRNYLEKNRSGERIRADQDVARDRKRRARSRIVDTNVTRDSSDPPVSVSISDLKIQESEGIKAAAPANEPATVPFACPKDLAMTAEAEAYAQLAGLTDVAKVWRDFVGHYTGGGGVGRVALDWQGHMWHRWADNEVPRQRTARERARGPLHVSPANEPDPEVTRAKLDAEQREAIAEQRRRRREAAPMPSELLDLLDKVGS